MSLLLQALQKAARNREGQGPAGDEHDPLAPSAAGAQADAPELSLAEPPRSEAPPEPELEELTIADEEDLFGPDVPAEQSREDLSVVAVEEDIAPARSTTPASAGARDDSPGRAQAATILRASESRQSGVIDWVRDRPVHAFAIAGGIFGVFYGGYVYLQIFHPGILRGDFLRQPALQAKAPPPTPARPLSPPQPPAAVPQPPGLPGAPAAPAATAAATPAQSSAEPAATVPAAGKVTAQDPATPAKPAGRATARKPVPGTAMADTGDDESEESAPARPAQRRPVRKPQLEVESVTLDDSVAVRTPESRSAPHNATLQSAWEALQAGRYAQAQSLYDEVASADPANLDALLGLGALATIRGNAEQAARLYGRALELDPRNTAAQAGLIAAVGQADPQLSESRLKQLLAREPSGFVYFALGNLYARQALWAQAQQAYFQAYQLQPDNPDYAYNLAVGLEHLGQSKIALNYYRKALELSNLRGRAEFDRSRVEERIGQLAARVGSQ